MPQDLANCRHLPPQAPRLTLLRRARPSLPSMAWLLALAGAVLTTRAGAAPQVFMVLDESNQPVGQAVLSVMVPGAKANATGTTVDLAQRDKTFVPSVLAIQVGTAVNLPNFDTVRHHVYSFSPIKPFEIKLYAGTPAAPVVFDQAGTATLGCNIHDRMLAYVHVVSTPYFGVTDSQGRANLDVPPGTHTVRLWAPRLGESNAPQESRAQMGKPVTLRLKTPPPKPVPN